MLTICSGISYPAMSNVEVLEQLKKGYSFHQRTLLKLFMKSCKNVGRKVLNQSLNCATDVFISDPNKRPDFRGIFQRLSTVEYNHQVNNENPQQSMETYTDSELKSDSEQYHVM
jgi:hypothetical protein